MLEATRVEQYVEVAWFTMNEKLAERAQGLRDARWCGLIEGKPSSLRSSWVIVVSASFAFHLVDFCLQLFSYIP